jgi:hypothetical protein
MAMGMAVMSKNRMTNRGEQTAQFFSAKESLHFGVVSVVRVAVSCGALARAVALSCDSG